MESGACFRYRASWWHFSMQHGWDERSDMIRVNSEGFAVPEEVAYLWDRDGCVQRHEALYSWSATLPDLNATSLPCFTHSDRWGEAWNCLGFLWRLLSLPHTPDLKQAGVRTVRIIVCSVRERESYEPYYRVHRITWMSKGLYSEQYI